MSEHTYWNEQNQLVSKDFDDIYFSTDNGLAETQYVFLAQNHLEERFAKLSTGDSFVIGETGFGTGLNFLATCQLWANTQDQREEGAQLHFVSVEKFPLDKAVIQKALSVWPELDTFLHPLLEHYPDIFTGFHRINLPQQISLTLIIDDAAAGFDQLMASRSLEEHTSLVARQWRGVDAWFLDGFAPSKNPGMWTEDLFQTLAALSHSKTSFATFTAAGLVKRGLAEVGFGVEKVAGFGHKRDMIRGDFTAAHKESTDINSANTEASKDPQVQSQARGYQYKRDNWALISDYQPQSIGRRIAVIGGGIAGCHSAYALAQKGYQVSLFEAEKLAGKASGNAQGVLYAKLSPLAEPQGDINLYSLLYAQAFYQRYWQETGQTEQACGVMQLALSDKQAKAHQQIVARFTKHSPITYLTASEASTLANTTLTSPAIFFPKAGWISPSDLCQWLCQHPNIQTHQYQRIKQLEHTNGQWSLEIEGEEAQSFDTVIIANALEAKAFTQSQYLPIKTVRGQVTHYPATSASQKLNTAICGKGYIAPANQRHCLGASFNLGEEGTALHADDHWHNLQNIAKQTPDLIDLDQWDLSDCKALDGRVGFRCVTPDYLPIVGPVPIDQAMASQYQILKHNAKHKLAEPSAYHPNLYINLGHGSRGLAYTPLASEILASLIHGSPPPIPQALLQKLSPSRFIIRELIRNT